MLRKRCWLVLLLQQRYRTHSLPGIATSCQQEHPRHTLIFFFAQFMQLCRSYSRLISKKLGMTDEDSTIWMKMKALNWHKHVDFLRFKRFCEGMPVVNDASERSVQLMSDYINNMHSEDDRQVLATSHYCNLLSGKSLKSDLVSAYANKLF